MQTTNYYFAVRKIHMLGAFFSRFIEIWLIIDLQIGLYKLWWLSVWLGKAIAIYVIVFINNRLAGFICIESGSGCALLILSNILQPCGTK